MNTIFDILVGMFIGGFLLVIVITATDSGTRAFVNFNSDAVVQSNLANTSNTIQYDLRKMGYEIPEAFESTILQVAQPNHLKFLSQLNLDAQRNLSASGACDQIPDTIEYTVSPLESINFDDTTLTIYKVQRSIKIANESAQNSLVGTIGNNDVFRYLDQLGDPVPIIQATRMVEVTLTAYNPRIILSPDMFSGGNSAEDVEFRKQELRRLLRASFWRQTRLVSKNLKR